MWFKKISFYKYFLVSWLLSVVSIVGILFTKKYLPPVLPLFYGKPVGVEELASSNFLFLVPLGVILISCFNFFISKSAKDVFIQKILAVTSLVVSFMATTTVFKIILLVGFF